MAQWQSKKMKKKHKKIPGSLPKPGKLAKNVVGNFFSQREREIMEVKDN